MSLTSRERFLKVLNGEMPDRVPTSLFIVDQGHFLTQMYPDLDPYNHRENQLKVIELQKQFGCDVFARMVYDINPYHIHFGGLDVSQQTENWEVHSEEYENGNTKIIKSKIRTPDGNLEQEFSINEIRKNTFMYACTKKPINTMEDLDIAIKYEPKISDEHIKKTHESITYMKKAVGDDGILGVWAPHGPFNMSSCLIDHTEMYSIFLTDFDFYDKLMKFSIDRIVPYMKAMDNAKPDVLCVGGNVPGGFLGERIYDTYILPYEKMYIDSCQENGTPAMYHNCGEIMNLINSYKKLGVKSVEPFSPKPLGDADLKKVKEEIGKDYVILGGVDQVNVLQQGNIDLVKKVTKETIQTGKIGGNFIIQSADLLEYNTPVENIEAFVKTAIEYGKY